MAVSEDALRLLDEVSTAHSLDDVRAIIARWRWDLAISSDPDLPAKFDRVRRAGGTPVSLEELRGRLGQPV
jgi:hypothetical protein